jgi:hypothetical protein
MYLKNRLVYKLFKFYFRGFFVSRPPIFMMEISLPTHDAVAVGRQQHRAELQPARALRLNENGSQGFVRELSCHDAGHLHGQSRPLHR